MSSYRYIRGPNEPKLPSFPTALVPPTHGPIQKIDVHLFPDVSTEGKVLPTSENLAFLMTSYGIVAGHGVGPHGEMWITVPGLGIDHGVPVRKQLVASIEEIKSKAARCGLPLQGLEKRITAYCARHPFDPATIWKKPLKSNQRIPLFDEEPPQ